MATKEQRKSRLARGLCANCSARPHLENETLCGHCKEQKKKDSKRYIEKKRKEKICYNCTNPVEGNYRFCNECREAKKLHYNKNKVSESRKRGRKPKNPNNPKPKKESNVSVLFDQVFDVERRILKNLIGKKYNHLEVIEYSHQIKYLNYWICKCVCGELRIVAQNHLKHATSCGCMNPVNNIRVIDKKTLEVRYKAIDYTGRIYGNYVVTGYSHLVQKHNYKDNYWECKCVKCGNERVISLNQLKSGNFASCKCDDTTKITFRELLYDLIKRAKEKTLKQKEVQVFDQASGKMITIKNDLVGKKIGNLLVLEFSYKLKKVHKWLCKCDCGTIDIYSESYLIHKSVTNCGCKKGEI